MTKTISMNNKKGKSSLVRNLYVKFIRSRISKEISRQRIKLFWFVWGYYPLINLKNLSIFDKLNLFFKFLKIDWNVIHSHKPSEMSLVCKALAERKANPGEVLLEAGCFNGGSSAKFSLVCAKLGYRLCVFDSFEGVEVMTAEEKEGNYDFSGQYAASEESVKQNIVKFGELDVCSFYKGWFSETLAEVKLPYKVRVAYIDCDLAKGTKEALQGVVPALTEDGWVFSQDYHIKPVIQMLTDPNTWKSLNKNTPNITKLGDQLASIRFLNQ